MRLQVMAALTIADEVSELRGKAGKLEAEVAELKDLVAKTGMHRTHSSEERFAKAIVSASERIERPRAQPQQRHQRRWPRGRLRPPHPPPRVPAFGKNAKGECARGRESTCGIGLRSMHAEAGPPEAAAWKKEPRRHDRQNRKEPRRRDAGHRERIHRS